MTNKHMAVVRRTAYLLDNAPVATRKTQLRTPTEVRDCERVAIYGSCENSRCKHTGASVLLPQRGHRRLNPIHLQEGNVQARVISFMHTQ